MTHSFNTDLAERYGIEKALLLDHICYWIAENERNEKNQIDGRTWFYNTSKALAEKFHYLSQRSIARYLEQLEKDGIILSGNFNINHFDNTKWYALSDEYLYLLNDYKSMREIKASNIKNIAKETKNSENIDIIENGKSICQNGKSICQNGKSDLPKWQVNKNIQTNTKEKENSFFNKKELKKNPQNKNFDFRLNKKTRVDKLSEIYKKELRIKIDEFRQKNPNAMSYDEFVSVLEANGYAYLNFWLAYQNWRRNEINRSRLKQVITNNANKSLSERLAEQEARILAKYENQQSKNQTQMLENGEAIDCEILGA